jgi:hypothetical protein
MLACEIDFQLVKIRGLAVVWKEVDFFEFPVVCSWFCFVYWFINFRYGGLAFIFSLLFVVNIF